MFSEVSTQILGLIRILLGFIVAGSILFFSMPAAVSAENSSDLKISGYLKTLNFGTESSGMQPETASDPTNRVQQFERLFDNTERARIGFRWNYRMPEAQKIRAKIDYDNEVDLGSFVNRGDFRIAKKQSEDRQAIDLTNVIASGRGGYYEQRLYRASFAYENPQFSVEGGRQQIPWGVCHFFTPVDVFNPFSVTQIEQDERDGVDAVNLAIRAPGDSKVQFVYTPRGGILHPPRYVARISRDVNGFELGGIGGMVHRDAVFGYDLAGNLGDCAVRSELLYRNPENEKHFFKFASNIDYNFPHNIYALLEYHYNGEGKSNRDDYETSRVIRGEIQQVATEYVALLLGHDFTPLLRLENSAILNLDDMSLFLRPEIRYELRSNLLLTAAAQLYLGSETKEFGAPSNLYLAEAKYSF
jgi:hypothetical protein